LEKIKQVIPSPVNSFTPSERRYFEEQAIQTPYMDAGRDEFFDGPFAETLIGARNTLTGAAVFRLVDFGFGLFDEDIPLNLTVRKGETNGRTDHPSFFLRNNPETIAEDLQDIPADDIPWILSSSTYQEYESRRRFILLAQPEVQQFGSAGGLAVGFAGDIGLMTTLGMLAEPLALSGLGVEAMAGQATARALSTTRAMELGQAVAEATNTVSRLGLTARYVALGVGEEVVYQAVKNGIDPAYDPSATQVLQDLTISGTAAGLLGGALFGKAFVRESVEATAREFRATRRTQLPGGYTVEYTDGFRFDNMAAADDMLFRPGSGSFEYEAQQVADDLWVDWQRSPRNVDLFAPGSREMNLGVIDPVELERAGGVYAFGEGPTTTLYQSRRADTGEMVWSTVPPPAAAGAPAARRIEFSSDVPPLQGKNWTEIKSKLGMPRNAPQEAVIERARKLGYDRLELPGKNGATEVIILRDLPKPQTRPPMGPVTGVRSAIKAAAWELSVAGVKLNENVFGAIARALVRTEGRRLSGMAFNKNFWDEVIVEAGLAPDVAAKLRPINERARIQGIDRSLLDVRAREDMVDAVYDRIRYGSVERGADEPPSLIFKVLSEIKKRGGRVNRTTVGEVIDELRAVSQNPPKRVNRRGATVLDSNARRAQVIQIINKRVKEGGEIDLSPSLLNQMNASAGSARSGAVAGATAGATPPTGAGTTPPTSGVPSTGGLAQDASDVPAHRTFIPGWQALGNQAARATSYQNKNGWARLIGFLAFNARRDFGTAAQPLTVFERGSRVVYQSLTEFAVSYRNGWIRFATGNGTNNVSNVGLVSTLVSMFKNRAMRKDFNSRVVAVVRSGSFNDPVQAVNDTAWAIRKILNNIHDFASQTGLAGFTKSAVNNYFPRIYRWERIRRLGSTPQGTKALQNLIKASWVANGRKVVIDGVEEVFNGDLDEAALVFTQRLISIAEGRENALLTAQDQELFDAILGLDGPLKAKVGSKTPFGRSRIILDEGAVVSTGADDFLGLNKSSLSLADLTNDDLPFVIRKYVTSVMGAANEKTMLNAFNGELAARGVKGPVRTLPDGTTVQEVLEVSSVDEMFDTAKRLGGGINAEHESGLREVMAALRYEPIHHGRTALSDKILGIAMPYGYLTTGGGFGLAQMGELSRIVGTVGLRTTLRQMPVILEMVQNWRNPGAASINFSALVDVWFGPSTDRIRRTIQRGLERGELTSDAYAGAVSRGLDTAANLMADISLLAPMTSMTQQLTAAATMQHLWDAATGAAKRMDDATLRTLGINPADYDRVLAFVKTNGRTRNHPLLGERLVDLANSDAVEMDLITTMIDRAVRTRVQDMPTRGDFHKGMFSFWGRLLTQFRTFNLKGVDNFLLQNVSRVQSGSKGAASKVVKEITATAMLSGLIQWARNRSDYESYIAAGDYEKAEELESLLDATGFVRGAFTGPSEFFAISALGDFTSQTLLQKDPIFSPYRFSGLEYYGFPALAMGRRAGGLAKDLYGATVGEVFGLDIERDITQGTLHKGRLLLPGQSIPGIKQWLNIKEQEITDEYFLPTTQPRNRDRF
jgi:hypothetical protein